MSHANLDDPGKFVGIGKEVVSTFTTDIVSAAFLPFFLSFFLFFLENIIILFFHPHILTHYGGRTRRALRTISGRKAIFCPFVYAYELVTLLA